MSDQDRAILYQLEKVDQGGDVLTLFEDRLEEVAKAFGLIREDDEDSPHYGDIKLPDGRYATLSFAAEIIDPKK